MTETCVRMANPDCDQFIKLREANEAVYSFVEVFIPPLLV